MSRSPFAAAMTYPIPRAVAVAKPWVAGSRTVAKAARKRAAVRRLAGPVVPASVWAVNVVCKAIGRSAYWSMTVYPLVRMFLLTHAAGTVTRGTTIAREMCCEACSYGYKRGGHPYCRGENNGRGCGCGHWPASRRGHKLKLAAFRCPQGRFDYGGLAAWLFRK